jgi:hypothetical protein
MHSRLWLFLAVAAWGCATPESAYEVKCGVIADLGYYSTQQECLSGACSMRDLGFLEAYDACLDAGGDEESCAPELDGCNPLCVQDTTLASD